MASDVESDVSSPLSSLPDTVPPSPSDASSPLRFLSQSPSPPPDMPGWLYPTPPASQQTSQIGSPAPDGRESSATTDMDGAPPAKRRRMSKDPKGRRMDHLDLRRGKVDEGAQHHLDRVLHVLHKHQKIVVIAGAGMSVSAGIPDFRSSTGLFKSLKHEHKLKGSGKHLFDASVYKDDTSTSSFHSMVSSLSRLTKDAKPTAFHQMLATVAKDDRLLRLYSQNVDGIDTGLEPLKTRVPLRKDGEGKWPRTVQLHGGLDKMVCSKCHELSDFDAELFSGPVPPLCPRCEEINDIRTIHEGKRSHGIGRLRPRMVLYNEHNPDDEAIGAVTREDLRKRPDAVIVVGTTLKVPGVRRIVREMCGVVRNRRGGVAIWINNDLPPVSKDLEDCFDLVVQSDCDEVASRAAMRKWDDPVEQDDFSEVSEEDAQMVERKTVEVQVPRCELMHANPARLPTQEHRNNSFPPPPASVTPKKAMDHGPCCSPISSRRASIVTSVEQEESITVATGLQTPTKSQRSTPVRKIPTINDKLKDAAKSKKPTGKTAKAATTMKARKSTLKYVKSHASQPKSTGLKPQSGLKTNALTNTFKQAKTVFGENKVATKKSLPSPMKSPSKLQQVCNASEPMQTVPPKNARSNTSPSKARGPVFPGLERENTTQLSDKKRSHSGA